MNQDDRASEPLYEGYAGWKRWDGKLPPRPSAIAHDYYSRELQRAGIAPGARILEVGFGNGEFLHWAKHNGYDIAGLEINEEVCRRARENGFTVHRGRVTDSIPDLGTDYDAIAAFDVLEHLRRDELPACLAAFNRLLKPGGRAIVRFPNGQSPFGLNDQYGDFTHLFPLTGRILDQLAPAAGFVMSGCYNAIRKRGKRFKLKKAVNFFLRDMLESVLGWLYYGGHIPLDPALVCVLVKK